MKTILSGSLKRNLHTGRKNISKLIIMKGRNWIDLVQNQVKVKNMLSLQDTITM
jgi:hypothetical protein